jgi:hypothetical protein
MSKDEKAPEPVERPQDNIEPRPEPEPEPELPEMGQPEFKGGEPGKGKFRTK